MLQQSIRAICQFYKAANLKGKSGKLASFKNRQIFEFKVVNLATL